ncbi:MAG: Flp family type IVb pilin [Pseudomonadota bacterium]
MTNLKKFFKDESGATAIEYGLLAALISIVAVGAFTTAGSNLNAVFETVTSKLAVSGAG